MTDPKLSERTAQCGTTRGYMRHRNEGTPTCDACKAANTAYMKAWRKKDGEAQRRNRALNSAQGRALWRLAAIHRAEFDELVTEELDNA